VEDHSNLSGGSSKFKRRKKKGVCMNKGGPCCIVGNEIGNWEGGKCSVLILENY